MSKGPASRIRGMCGKTRAGFDGLARAVLGFDNSAGVGSGSLKQDLT